jgi:hypothetical protein
VPQRITVLGSPVCWTILKLTKLERNLVVIVVGSTLVAVSVAGVAAYLITNALYQYAEDAAFGLQQYCGRLTLDGQDVSGLIGIKNPSSVAVDAAWSFDFDFNGSFPFGAVSFHVPSHGIAYVEVRFYGLGPYDNLGGIDPTSLTFTSHYHVMIWSFDQTMESSGKMAVPFSSSPPANSSYPYQFGLPQC